jgi:predicted ATP-dependent endonuclease of OLD family
MCQPSPRPPVLSPQDKEYLKLLTRFDPVKNELFFARKVIFVEGPCDRYAVLLSAGLLGKALDEKCITVTDCGSKDSMPFFLMIANAFKIPYAIMFDTDSDKADGPKKSKTVKDAVDPKLCISIKELEPRLEVELGLSTSEKLHPPDVIRTFQSLRSQDVPVKIRELIEATLS